MIMFCHTCWNLKQCCICDAVAPPVHPDERVPEPATHWVRLPGGQVVPMTDEQLADYGYGPDGPNSVIAEAEEVTRQAADR